MEEQLKLISDERDFYLVEEPTGKKFRLYKINVDLVNQQKQDLIRKIYTNLPVGHLNHLVMLLEAVVNEEPTVSEYKVVSSKISDYLKQCYEIVGSPNLLHGYIKSIDPEIYGKAQTFMDEIKQLLEIMYEVQKLG